MSIEKQCLHAIHKLNVNKSGERRAPHKPLLLLIAISNLSQGKKTLSFPEVKTQLAPLLAAYAPPVASRHQPELPYWHLQNDGLWEVPGSGGFPRQAGGFPKMAALTASSGHLASKFADALLASKGFLSEIVESLLDEHFPESIHGDILEAVGLHLEGATEETEERAITTMRRRRDPQFRRHVLRAYEHRCAATGFRAAISGTYFGCEAAHVQWHAQGGPDDVENGFAVEPTLHKLFDVGAWTLTDDRRILISAELTGSDSAVDKIRGLHGQPLRPPVPGYPRVSLEYIQWHREPERGGVFRHPALPL